MRTLDPATAAEAQPRKSRRPSWVAPKSRHDPEGDNRKFRKARFAHMRALAKLANDRDPGKRAGLCPRTFLERVRGALTAGEPLTTDGINASCNSEGARLHQEHYEFLYESSRRIPPHSLFEAEVILDLYERKVSAQRHVIIGVDFCPMRDSNRFRAVMFTFKGDWMSGLDKDIPAGMK